MLYKDMIQARRATLGLTQAQLARLANVSVPFIQLMEAGTANPSIRTLSSIAEQLGFQVQLEAQNADWSELVAHGAPLMNTGSSRKRRKLTGEILVRQLRLAALELSGGDQQGGEVQRKREAVSAVLLALKIHFPKYFKNHFGRAKVFEPFLAEPNGRLIKLSREARAVLASYL